MHYHQFSQLQHDSVLKIKSKNVQKHNWKLEFHTYFSVIKSSNIYATATYFKVVIGGVDPSMDVEQVA